MKFELQLLDELDNTRLAILDTESSSLFWKDSSENLITNLNSEQLNSSPIHPISKLNPGKKTSHLKTIKIQLGFACNFTCNYCSQNSLRDKNVESISNQILKTESFISKLPSFFGAGEFGDGRNVSIEFWGGETLIYWDSVKILTKYFRAKFPIINLGLFTNGSLINNEMADFALEYKLHFIISHDGPTFNEDRSKDPLDTTNTKQSIKYLFDKLSPYNLVSFNATVSIKNYSLIKIAEYIAERLNVTADKISLHYELATPYDLQTLEYVVKKNQRNEYIQKIYYEYLSQYPFKLFAGNLGRDLQLFYQNFSQLKKLNSYYQKCNMDNPSSIAVDLEGNVLTCQNVTSTSGHKIGSILEFEKISLNTSTHFLNRKSCIQCPVVNICKGSCMFLEGNMWEAACEQHFTWSLAFLALALKLETNHKLISIQGQNIRNKDETMISVIL
jgi:uncharacterized protein